MKVSKLMSSRIVSVDMDDTLSKVKTLFQENHFHHLMVIHEGRLMGVLSDRDFLKAVSPKVDMIAATKKDIATLNKRVHQIMTRKPIFLNQDANLKDAVHVFNHEKISCIPIVDENERPIGVLSWRDIFRAMEKLK